MSVLIKVLFAVVITILFFYAFLKISDDADEKDKKLFEEWWDKNNNEK